MADVDVESFFSKSTKVALKNNPPGEWIPELPKECIRLSSGYPAPALIPVKQLKQAAVRLLEEEQDLPLHYLGSPSIAKLKELVQERLAKTGIHVSPGELLITSGACQALDLVARILIDDDTVVAIESPTYMEALEIFQNYTNQFINIPVDEHGLKTNRLEELLSERKKRDLPLPRFLYTIPTFQNPTGTTMTSKRRQHLLELADTYHFLILEDHAYGELFFTKRPIPLKAMDKKDRVLHIGSFSKVVAPGMRIGWITGVSDVISALAWFKKDLDHPFAQATMASYLQKTSVDERFSYLRGTYKGKCEVLLSALEQYLPRSASWFVPEGGYFVWVKIEGVDTSQLLTYALAKGVSYIPGKYFFHNQEDGTNYLRLSFSYAEEKEIVKGIKILGKVITSQLS